MKNVLEPVLPFYTISGGFFPPPNLQKCCKLPLCWISNGCNLPPALLPAGREALPLPDCSQTLRLLKCQGCTRRTHRAWFCTATVPGPCSECVSQARALAPAQCRLPALCSLAQTRMQADVCLSWETANTAATSLFNWYISDSPRPWQLLKATSWMLLCSAVEQAGVKLHIV